MPTAFLLVAVLIASSAPAANDEFIPLFDGKSLDGWTFIVKPGKDGKKADPKDTWSVTPEGYIRCRRRSRPISSPAGPATSGSSTRRR